MELHGDLFNSTTAGCIDRRRCTVRPSQLAVARCLFAKAPDVIVADSGLSILIFRLSATVLTNLSDGPGFG